jgi:hypothetical protein
MGFAARNPSYPLWMILIMTVRQFFRDTKFLWELGLGGTLAAMLTEAAVNLRWITMHIYGNILILEILAVSYGLYLIRHFSRLAYGTLEILVGLFVIAGTMSREPEHVAPGLLMVQLAAGMYVIIRGFDNWAQAEPFAGGGSKIRALCDLIRPKKNE